MSKKGLIIRLIGKVAFAIILSVVGSFFIRSPVISNWLALMQMQNDNVAYITMDFISMLRSAAQWLLPFVEICICLSMANDAVKYFTSENKKENT